MSSTINKVVIFILTCIKEGVDFFFLTNLYPTGNKKSLKGQGGRDGRPVCLSLRQGGPNLRQVHSGSVTSPVVPRVGVTFLTHHARILLSHPGVGYLYSPPPPPLHLHQCYPTLPNYLFMTTITTTTAELNKLPLTIIIFIIIDGTIRFNNHKIQTHALGSICVRHDGI